MPDDPTEPTPGSRPAQPRVLGRVGFETGSETYERARPDYPSPAVDHIVATAGIRRGSRLLDLAAGTGKLTRQLRARGASCVAVEPSPSMQQVFRHVVPGVPITAGTAEAIPMASGSVDAVVVAQAFHWFDPDRSLAEIARVTRPGGWLALVWNERDESDPTVAEVTRISKWDREQPYPMGKDFGTLIDRTPHFGPVERTKFQFVQWVDRDQFVDQVASRSYVQVMSARDRREVLARIAELGSSLAEPIAVPYITDLFCAQVRTS